MMTPDRILVAESCFPGSNSCNLAELHAVRCRSLGRRVRWLTTEVSEGRINVVCWDEYSLKESEYDTEPI
jgi:hypothetical protein